MDSRDNFLRDFKNWITGIDDDYLVGISNKGIFNRALKELDGQSGVFVNIDDQKVSCTLPDGNSCSFTTDIRKFKCSCPSRSICKHVIMALIYIRQNMGQVFEGLVDSDEVELDDKLSGNEISSKEENTANAFNQILDITPAELRKIGGEKAYEEALFRIDFGLKADIREGKMLTVKLADEDIAVRFTESEPVRDSICTCRSSAFCRHKVEAVMLYQLHRGRSDFSRFSEAEAIEKPKETMLEIKKHIGELIVSGLSRLPESSMEAMEQMAVICHCSGLPALEKLFRRLKSEAQLYFSKNAGFSRERMKNISVRIYNLCLAIENTGDDPAYLKKLIGEHRTTYYDIPPVAISGMGAESWTADSGFEGLTFYFYYEQGEKWFTYTNARPVYYEDTRVNTSRMYKASPPWGVEGTLEEFSKACIKLYNGKANKEGRLSSSEDSHALLTGRTDINKIKLDKYIYEEWTEIQKKLEASLSYNLIGFEKKSILGLVKVYQWGNSTFDGINQFFSLPVYDKKGEGLEIAIKYSEKNKYLIEKLEAMERIKDLPYLLLGDIYAAEGKLRIKPITAWYGDGRAINLTLD